MPTILIADDEACCRKQLTLLLANRGFDLVEADDGNEAFRLARSILPDLVISDISMPGADGYQLARWITADPALAGVRIILWSGVYLDDEARALARDSNASIFLTKPADAKTILAAVDEVLGRPRPLDTASRDGDEHLVMDRHLALLNRKLLEKITEQNQSHAALERRVAGQVSDLQKANANLVREVERRRHMEDVLSTTNEILNEHATRDTLTGLHNRRFFDDALGYALIRAQRCGQPVSVIMADIDYFKRCNDTFGHGAGDLLLRAVAHYLSGATRDNDTVCRYGGEEFVLLLPDAPLPIAVQRAEMLRTGVESLDVAYEATRIGPVSISLGVASFPVHGDRESVLLEAADRALYDAKRRGRNRVECAA